MHVHVLASKLLLALVCAPGPATGASPSSNRALIRHELRQGENRLAGASFVQLGSDPDHSAPNAEAESEEGDNTEGADDGAQASSLPEGFGPDGAVANGGGFGEGWEDNGAVSAAEASGDTDGDGDNDGDETRKVRRQKQARVDSNSAEQQTEGVQGLNGESASIPEVEKNADASGVGDGGEPRDAPESEQAQGDSDDAKRQSEGILEVNGESSSVPSSGSFVAADVEHAHRTESIPDLAMCSFDDNVQVHAVHKAIRKMRKSAKKDTRKAFAQIASEALADLASKPLDDGPCRKYLRRLRLGGSPLKKRLVADFLESKPTPCGADARFRVRSNLAIVYLNDIRAIESQVKKLKEALTCQKGRDALDKEDANLKRFEKKLLKQLQRKQKVDEPLHRRGHSIRDREDWTNVFSTHIVGHSPRSKIPIDKLRCHKRFCAEMRTHYLNRPLDDKTGYWTRGITERDSGVGKCPKGHVVMQVACKGKFCSKLSLFCQKPDLTKWQVDDSATEEKGWFSEHFEGLSTCSTGYVLYGLKCSGIFCRSKKMLCKGTKPPARDCRWGPWTQWTECRGMCGYAHKKRNRTVWLPERHGGSCTGINNERRQCDIPGCTA